MKMVLPVKTVMAELSVLAFLSASIISWYIYVNRKMGKGTVKMRSIVQWLSHCICLQAFFQPSANVIVLKTYLFQFICVSVLPCLCLCTTSDLVHLEVWRGVRSAVTEGADDCKTPCVWLGNLGDTSALKHWAISQAPIIVFWWRKKRLPERISAPLTTAGCTWCTGAGADAPNNHFVQRWSRET